MIEATENSKNIKLLSESIQNGKIHKSSRNELTMNEANEPINLKIYFQNEEAEETEMVLLNEKCTYNGGQYSLTRNSVTSLSLTNNASSTEWMKVQKTDCIYPTTGVQQFSILLCRMLLQISRNRTGNIIIYN